MLYFYISMFCIDKCYKQSLGELLHSVEICFVTNLLNLKQCTIYICAISHDNNLTLNQWYRYRLVFSFV